jgi:hypothetical protein
MRINLEDVSTVDWGPDTEYSSPRCWLSGTSGPRRGNRRVQVGAGGRAAAALVT